MNSLKLHNFNIELTLLGGQAFNWQKFNDCFYGVFENCVVKFKYSDSILEWQTYPKKDDFQFIKKLLDLDFDYENSVREISNDEIIAESLKVHRGLRLLHQPFPQTFISFIISQNSNIPKIKRSLSLLSNKFNRQISVDNIEFTLFPTLQEISEFSIEELYSTGIGYRAKFIQSCVRECLEKDLHNRIEKMDFKVARYELIKLHGIGDKVADCILVFGLGFKHITPLDLWAKRALINLYNLDPKQNYDSMMKFLQNRFGENTALAGQFLFEYVRLKKVP